MEISLGELTNQFRFGIFHPHCLYDSPLDAIRVVVEDTSWTETAYGQNLSFNERNHYPGRRFVGFSIEGARGLCDTYGLKFGNGMQVTPLLQILARNEPETALVIQDIAIPMVTEFDLNKVEFLTDE